MQICDIFVQELNNVDKNVSLELLAELLNPFLQALAAIENREVKDRIKENIFSPILENNKTVQEQADSDDEEFQKKMEYHRFIDGGKMNPKTVREVREMIN